MKCFIPIEPGCLIDLRNTQEDLAEMLGTTRMTVVTAIQQLRRAKIMFGRRGKLKLDHLGPKNEVESWA